jgi:hypothetical protein
MSEHQIFYPPPANPEMSVHEAKVFGIHSKRCQICGMPLELGSGARSAAMQCRLVHIPEIRRTQGNAAADAVLLKLDGAERRLAMIASAPLPVQRQ